jgi:hypothetical protein
MAIPVGLKPNVEHPNAVATTNQNAHEDSSGQPNLPNALFWERLTPILARSQRMFFVQLQAHHG